MNVMQTNVAREPSEDLRQLEIRTTLQRHSQRVPKFMAGPIHTFKLMLNIKQPQAKGAGDQNYRQLDQEICLKANR